MEYGYIGHGFKIQVVLVQFKCLDWFVHHKPQTKPYHLWAFHIFSIDMYFQFSSEFVFRSETSFGFASCVKTTLQRTKKFHEKIYRITSGFGQNFSMVTIIPGNQLVRFGDENIALVLCFSFIGRCGAFLGPIMCSESFILMKTEECLSCIWITLTSRPYNNKITRPQITDIQSTTHGNTIFYSSTSKFRLLPKQKCTK